MILCLESYYLNGVNLGGRFAYVLMLRQNMSVYYYADFNLKWIENCLETIKTSLEVYWC